MFFLFLGIDKQKAICYLIGVPINRVHKNRRIKTMTKLFTRTCNNKQHLYNLIKWARRHNYCTVWSYNKDNTITADVYKQEGRKAS